MSFGFWKPSGTDEAVAATATAASSVRGGEGYHRGAPPVAAPQAPVSGPLAQQRLRLPIYRHKRQILYALENYEVLIIVGVSAAVSCRLSSI
jgi:hypothetical protein